MSQLGRQDGFVVGAASDFFVAAIASALDGALGAGAT